MFLSNNSTRSLLLLLLISLQSFVQAETAAPSTQTTSVQQVSQPKTPTREIDCPERIGDLPKKTDEQEPAQQISQLDTLLNSVLQQTNQIDSLLQDIALVTGNNQSLSKDQRLALVKEIRTIRAQLAPFKNQSFTQADEQSIYLLLVINKELCDHLNKALAQGFTSLEPFPLEKQCSRAVQLPLLTIDQLSQAITDNEISVAKLGTSAATIGLTWYNKLYRGIDSYVFQPWQKYNVTHYGMIALGTTAIAVGSWWYFTERGSALPTVKKAAPIDNALLHQKILDAACICPLSGQQIDAKEVTEEILREINPEEHVQQLFSGTKLEQWLRKLMGPHPEYKKISVNDGSELQRITNYGKLKLPGYIEYNYGKAALTLAAAKYYAWPQVKYDYYALKNFISKKIIEIHNNLKGGSFKGHSIKNSLEDFFKKPTCTLTDIVGAQKAKEIFYDLIDYLVSPETYDLAKITPEKGYLLTGPSRTGKTYIAEAFAGEVRKRMATLGKNPDSIHFLSITHQDIQSSRENGGLTGILNFAKRYAPCIVFIDEIDLLNLQRSGDTGMLSDFLVALSDFSHQDSDKQVIVIAATNRSENIDDALKRKGRLGVEIRFSYPSADYRKEFLTHKLETIGISTDEIDLDSIIQQTSGRSFNDLDSILKKALQRAKTSARILDQELLEQAVDSEIFSILPESDHPLSPAERHLIAAAIAGEALITYTLNTGTIIARATINPYSTKLQEKSALSVIFKEDSHKKEEAHKQQDLIKFGKIFTSTDFEYLREDLTEEQIKNTCKQLLAGGCAQQILLGVSTHNPDRKENMQKCYTLAKELISKNIDSSMLSDKMRDSFADKAFDLVTTMEQETIALLTQHKEQLEQLTAALLKLNTLNGDIITYILGGQLAADIAQEKEKEKEKKQDTTTVIKHPAAA